jgi:hypothetical protein
VAGEGAGIEADTRGVALHDLGGAEGRERGLRRRGRLSARNGKIGPVLPQAVSAIGIDRRHLRATSQQWLGTGSHWARSPNASTCWTFATRAASGTDGSMLHCCNTYHQKYNPGFRRTCPWWSITT